MSYGAAVSQGDTCPAHVSTGANAPWTGIETGRNIAPVAAAQRRRRPDQRCPGPLSTVDPAQASRTTLGVRSPRKQEDGT